MAKNKGTFIIDENVTKDERERLDELVQKNIAALKEEIDERKPILTKRQDFFEGRTDHWTNVMGLRSKNVEGRLKYNLNYIRRFCVKVQEALTNHPPRIKIKPQDEADDIEVIRSEGIEDAIRRVLRDNRFYEVAFKRCANNQIRDGDFVLSCRTVRDDEGKRIEISHAEDLLKIAVGWDDAAGREFSFIAFADQWSLNKVKREFNFDAEAWKDDPGRKPYDQGDHLRDQYGLFAQDRGTSSKSTVPSGQNKLPKAEVIDYWGYEVLKKKGDDKAKLYVVNMIYINRELQQFIVTDYKKIPSFVGHSFGSAGKPWSYSFVDDLIDAQLEINDRSAEEGDLVRIGSHVKFVAVGMQDFDAKSIKPGEGQVIFVEEGQDFRPLNINTSHVPSEAYLNRMLDHLFNLGIPKIALAAGTAPYTGRVAATQYQPFVDLVNDLRSQWEIVLTDLIKTIQQYFIDYFPEMREVMAERVEDPVDGQMIDGEPIVRDVEFDWDNVLPLSRSDKVVDASTMYDRGALPIAIYLEEAGFPNPTSVIKQLKKERQDPDLMSIKEKFAQFSPGVVQAQLAAAQAQRQQEEQNGEAMGNMENAMSQPTPKSNAPILHQDQNDGKRGVLSATGTPTGQTATLKGNVAQTTQNMNARNGI